MTLENILDELSRFGKPRLTQSENGWYCHCKLDVQAKGSDFDIKSEYGHATHVAAAAECLERVQAVLRDIHKMAIDTPLNILRPALELNR